MLFGLDIYQLTLSNCELNQFFFVPYFSFLHYSNLEGYVLLYGLFKKETKIHFQILIESWFVACCHTKLIQNVNLVSIFEVEKVEWILVLFWASGIMQVSHFCHFPSLLIFCQKSNKMSCGKIRLKECSFTKCTIDRTG